MIGSIPVQYPVGITFNSNNHDLYVASQLENVAVIDTGINNVIGTIPILTAGEPYGADFNSANQNIYITGDNSNILSVINSTTNTVIASLPTSSHPRHILFDPLNNKIYVTNTAGVSPGAVSVFNSITNTFSDSIAVGNSPWGIALNQTNGNISVANSNDNTFSQKNYPSNNVI